MLLLKGNAKPGPTDEISARPRAMSLSCRQTYAVRFRLSQRHAAVNEDNTEEQDVERAHEGMGHEHGELNVCRFAEVAAIVTDPVAQLQHLRCGTTGTQASSEPKADWAGRHDGHPFLLEQLQIGIVRPWSDHS